MRRIFIDLEMNPVAKGQSGFRRKCSDEVIEFGAVILDEEMGVADSFREYVRPEYNRQIERRITRLTGITTEKVARAKAFQEVFLRFLDWCGREDYEIYSWSDSDIWQLMKELSAKEVPDRPGISYMLNHWRDLQDEFQEMVRIDRLISLEDAVDMAGLPFEGRAHDALTDAKNTAALFRASKDSDLFEKMRRECEEAMKEHTFTLADVFDFATLIPA